MNLLVEDLGVIVAQDSSDEFKRVVKLELSEWLPAY